MISYIHDIPMKSGTVSIKLIGRRQYGEVWAPTSGSGGSSSSSKLCSQGLWVKTAEDESPRSASYGVMIRIATTPKR